LGSFEPEPPFYVSPTLHQERNQSYLEEQILNQVNVVFEGQIFPAWISRQTVVHLKIGTHAPTAKKTTLRWSQPHTFTHLWFSLWVFSVHCASAARPAGQGVGNRHRAQAASHEQRCGLRPSSSPCLCRVVERID
jgi:hypothetical protein